MKEECANCRCQIQISKNPNQRYCGAAVCQQVRRREWKREKHRKDADYRANKQAAHIRWSKSHQGYWREYRKKNPGYAQRNRELQQSRNRHTRTKKEQGVGEIVIAKGNALELASLLKSRGFELYCTHGVIAKGNALMGSIAMNTGLGAQ